MVASGAVKLRLRRGGRAKEGARICQRCLCEKDETIRVVPIMNST